MKHLMLDLETMGNESYSSIVSIGAVEFDIETGELGKEYYQTIDLQSNLDAGLIMNASTVMWWMDQNDEARKELTGRLTMTIENALNDFSKFCNHSYQVWGNSARFDCGILQNAYQKLNLPLPWDWRKERCLRTLVQLKPEIKRTVEFKGTVHNAIDDCKFQIEYCHKTWLALKNQ